MTQNIRQIQRRMGEFFAYADAEYSVGQSVHLGFGSRGGAGFYGKITKLEDGKVWIRNSEGKEYSGPIRLLSEGKADSSEPFSKGDRVKINAPGLPGHGKSGKILGKSNDHYQIQSGPDDNKNWMHPASRLTKADSDSRSDASLSEAKRKAMEESRNGYVQHVNEVYPGVFKVEDWYDYEQTRVSYENGREK